jgi:creatinine amidohydrolase
VLHRRSNGVEAKAAKRLSAATPLLGTEEVVRCALLSVCCVNASDEVMMGNEVRLEALTATRVAEIRDQFSLAVVPVSPLEWHGPHLPYGTDGIHAHEIAIRVCQEVGGVVCPPLHIGIDSPRGRGTGPEGLRALGFDDDKEIVGMDFPGLPIRSLYIDPTPVAELVAAVARALQRNGFKWVVLLSAHGAAEHRRVLQAVADETSGTGGLVVSIKASEVLADDGVGHADRIESAIMLHLHPELVDLGALPASGSLSYREFGIVDPDAFRGHPTDGFVIPERRDPRRATAEEGEQLVRREVADVATKLGAFVGQAV